MGEPAEKNDLIAGGIEFRLFDAVLDVVLVVDSTRSVVYCNPWAAHFFSVSEKRILSGIPFDQILRIDDVDIFSNTENLKPFEFTPYTEITYKALTNDLDGRMQVCVQKLQAENGHIFWGVFGRDISTEVSLHIKYQEKIREAQNLYEELEITQRTLLSEILKNETNESMPPAPTSQPAVPTPPPTPVSPPPNLVSDSSDGPAGLNLQIAKDPNAGFVQAEKVLSQNPNSQNERPLPYSVAATLHTSNRQVFKIKTLKIFKTFIEVSGNDLPINQNDPVVIEVLGTPQLKPFTAQCQVSMVMSGNPRLGIYNNSYRLKFIKLSALSQKLIDEFVDQHK
ncbi:MAG: hypothetical protein H6626_07145 [Pseudobdellovibrionaceae bacterium]|nr:MAG: hypothetical protein H6626_07145 [Pseudobdellovibrionaceae bacterium]